MDVQVREAARADTIVIPLLEGPARWVAAVPDRALRNALDAVLRSGDATGRFLEVTPVHPLKGPVRRAIVVGIGRPADLTPHRVRQWAAIATRRARDAGAKAFALALGGLAPPGATSGDVARAAAEGVKLGSWRFTAYRTGSSQAVPARAELVLPRAPESAGIRRAATRGARWGDSVLLARDLAHTPASDLTPAALADRARAVAREAGARARVIGARDLDRLGLRAIAAVGRGSPHPPCLVELERAPVRGRAAAGTVALIGKGVTFDTGGISIKPREGMGRMKYDMSGAAAVLGVFAALADLDPPFRVVGLIPAAENMPDGVAFKPGDVIRAHDGTTIDVTNTDAEGRLLLADALSWVRRWKPDVVVDLATLTGAITVALGPLAAGLFTADDALAAELEQASRASGERLWRMPLWDEYANDLRHGIADLENSGPRDGGACVAAAFLAHFARGLRWAHLDIASTAWAHQDRPHEPRGPTGYGVRLILEWLRARGAAAPAAPAG